MKLINDDCLNWLKKQEDNSVHLFLTDPPYQLDTITKRFGKEGSAKAKYGKDGAFQRASRGFMHKFWDVLPTEEILSEIYRVLKPGGFLVAFSSPRTYHKLAYQSDEVGFEIHPFVSWCYGCYSEDTECLTIDGWKKYNKLTKQDKILQWDKDTNKLEWINPKEIFIYDYNGLMYRFENRHTEQLITPNHNVIAKINKHQRNEKLNNYQIEKAENIKKHWVIDFPIAGKLDGNKKIDYPYLIGWWMTDAWKHKDGKAVMFSQSKIKTLNKLRKYFDDNNFKYSEYIKKGKKETHKDEHTFYVTGNIADYLLNNFNNRKLTWDILQWDFNSRFQLLEGLLDGDGSRQENRGYSEVFWSKNKKRLDIIQALCLSLNIRSHIDYKKGCVYLNRKRNSTQLQSKHKKEPINYNGKVWCLKTDTGAFVIRRNGKTFISGNSGFTKAVDCSKTIDRKLGKEREVIGKEKGMGKQNPEWNGTAKGRKENSFKPEYDKTKPSSDLAKLFNGYKLGRQTLKPANEPIGIYQKPIETQSQIDNVLKHGTGVYNIDDTRIGTDNNLNGGRYSDNTKGNDGNSYGKNINKRSKNNYIQPKGRFPSNIIITDESARILDKQSGESISDGGINKHKEFNKIYSKRNPIERYNYKDTGGASRFFQQCNYSKGDFESFFYTSKCSVVERNIGCDNLPAKQIKEQGGPRTYNDRCKNCGKKFVGEVNICKCENPETDSTVFRQKNFHPCLKPVSILLYLFKMFVSPIENFKVVDPFMGSGSTGMASVLFDNVEFIGIEKEKDYYEIAKVRCAYAEKNKKIIKDSLNEKNKVDWHKVKKNEKKKVKSDKNLLDYL